MTVNTSHPLYTSMAEIVAATYGPVPVLRDLLGSISTIESAFIYGSWAARRAGRAGPLPRDVDLMVIGDISVDDLVEVQSAARSRLGLPVNVHRTTAEAWAEPGRDPFLGQVAASPTVVLIGKAPAYA